MPPDETRSAPRLVRRQARRLLRRARRVSERFRAATARPARIPSTPPFRIHPFEIRELPLAGRPYADGAIPSLTERPEHADAEGVPLQLRGDRLVYHPVALAQLGLDHVAAHRRTGDPEHLARARRTAAALVGIGVPSGGGLFLPYRFDFSLHSRRSETLRAPWYSGMAQGMALSLVSRLSEITGDPRYRPVADRLVASLRQIGPSRKPWVSWVDGDGYLWIEEYAEPAPEHTLNGFMFATFGLYDHVVATRDPEALDAFRGALTTLRAHVMDYRNPGAASHYCIEHRVVSPRYHAIHIWQLRALAAMTGDPAFASAAAVFEGDLSEQPQARVDGAAPP